MCACCKGTCGCGATSCSCSGWYALVARVFLAVVFLFAGYGKIVGFAGTVAGIASMGVPFPQVMTVLAIILEFGGAVLLVIGYRARLAAWGMILFTAVTTYVFHRNFADPMQMIQALKNLSIIGGLLMVVAYGPGKMSLKCKCGGASCAECGNKCDHCANGAGGAGEVKTA